jgi:transcriptional regulator with XRE-family HTH domain
LNSQPHLGGKILLKTLGSKQHKKLIAILIAKREKANVTQTELATALGEYQSFVARPESGERRIDVVELIQLARVMGFDASEIAKEVGAIKEWNHRPAN